MRFSRIRRGACFTQGKSKTVWKKVSATFAADQAFPGDTVTQEFAAHADVAPVAEEEEVELTDEEKAEAAKQKAVEEEAAKAAEEAKAKETETKSATEKKAAKPAAGAEGSDIKIG